MFSRSRYFKSSDRKTYWWKFAPITTPLQLTPSICMGASLWGQWTASGVRILFYRFHLLAMWRLHSGVSLLSARHLRVLSLHNMFPSWRVSLAVCVTKAFESFFYKKPLLAVWGLHSVVSGQQDMWGLSTSSQHIDPSLPIPSPPHCFITPLHAPD